MFLCLDGSATGGAPVVPSARQTASVITRIEYRVTAMHVQWAGGESGPS
jgi:hypothetical protein